MTDEDLGKQVARMDERMKSMAEDIKGIKDDARTAANRVWFIGLAVISAVVMQVLKSAGVLQ